MFRAVRMRSALRKVATITVSAAVAATLLNHLPAQAAQRLTPQHDQSVPGKSAPERVLKVPATGKPYAPRAAKWPAGSAEAKLTASGRVKTGDLPVYLAKPAGAARGAAGSIDQAKVDVLDRAQTAKANVDGVLMRVQRTDGQAGAGQLRVSVAYGDFASAHGGDWAHRLRLVALPECALSTPDAVGCAGVPLASINDPAAQTVSADVAVQAGMLLAATAAASGSAGDFTATSLQPSSTWSAGGNSGNFAWSYPLRVPPAPGALAPSVGLSYSSQSVDGRMAASNNQPSWIGEGFDYSPGFIERRYEACDKNVSGDLCQPTDNATLSLNGSSTELIYEQGKGWHGRSEDGSRIERRTGVGNGDDNGEHWVVTAPNGTQYWFGLTPAANSTWTVPVKIGGSWTTQAWRWNLDYVVDIHANTMALQYQKELNKYARNSSAADVVEYVRGGYLERIDYGTRAGASGSAPIQVGFEVADRCLTAGCATHDAANWPDVPWDQECTGSPCTNASPTFWTTNRLSKVTTRLRVDAGSSYRDVESWTLHHTFPDPGDTTRAGLWLDRIARTAGGTTLPDVRFVGVQMPNRVDAIDHSPAMNWWRISQIHTETGGSINVTYSAPQCAAGAPESNNQRCYPVRWTPSGYTSPITDWFHKYVVTAVSESDDATGAVRVLNKYEYLGDPAWHYSDDDGLIDEQDKTWSVWRGYGKVRTIKGDPADQQVTETAFFRGMHGDKLPSGTRSVQLPAAGSAPAADDEDAFAGMVRETVVLNGAAEVSGQVTVPWQSAPTASRTINGQSVHARFTGTAATHSRTTLDGGRAPRKSTVRNTYDTYGMVVKTEQTGDDTITGDEQCVNTTFEPRNTTVWLTSLPHRVQTLARDCASVAPLTEADIIGDARTSYDGGAWGSVPAKGDVTRIETLKTLTEYQTMGTSLYDAYGRVVEAVDIKNNKTTTVYTHNAGGQLASSKVTNHLGWETTTTAEPAWGSPLSTVDPNGRVTEVTYDGLGRTTAVWLPGRSKTSQTASKTYEYLVRNNAPTVVTTSTLNPAGGYVTSRVLYDGLLRVRQTQVPEAGTTGGRIITDTIYDSAGRAYKALGPYVADGAPDTGLFTATFEEAIASQTLAKFDGTGRQIETVFRPKGIAKYSTLMSYGGDRVDVTPPAGGTKTSTVTDIRGRAVELRQYRNATEYDATTYTFNRKGQQESVKDSVGNTWLYEYDLQGRPTKTTDPDKGITTSGYNEYGELVSTTDARAKTLAYRYDTLGRKVSTHDDTVNGPLRAEWVYDTLVKNKPTKSIRYDGANQYINEVTSYNTAYQPLGTKVTIPASETGLAGSYAYTSTYHPDGSLKTGKLPALGGLAVETLTYGYANNGLGLPTSLDTSIGSTDGDPVGLAHVSYTRFGEVGVIGRWFEGGARKWLDTGFSYEEDTRRVNRLLTGRSTNPSMVSDLHYGFDDAGNILSRQDKTTGAEETQCFRSDYLRRLTEAWTPSAQDCATQPSTALGGPAPYWTSWEFDKTGNRTKQLEHATAAGDRTTTYTYPAAHKLSQASAADNTGTRTTDYTYDNAGNTLTRGGKSLSWDAEGRLSTNDGSSYLYDADGNRLIARDATGKTLYLPGQELRYTTSGGAKAGTRYYSFGGQTIGQRIGSTVTWLVNDHQGTSVATVAESTQAITRRYQDPYGNLRGPQTGWANDKGHVGGTKDPTGLTHLGAREYDPTVGRFISVDPIMDLADPQQWNAYSYANASPITKSDPTGLRPECGQGNGNDTCDNTAPTASGSTGGPSGGWTNNHAGYNHWGRPIVVTKTTQPKPDKLTWLLDQWSGIQVGSLDTVWSAAKGLGQMAWTCNTIAIAANGGGCGVYDLAATAIDDPGAAGSILWHGIADPIAEDWSNGNYGSAAGRAGTEILMAIGGPKGVNRLGLLGKASRPTAVVADVRKFSDYVFKEGATHGKDAVFRSYGYTGSDSGWLARDYARQATQAYRAGNYTLGKLDQYGQRVTIPIELRGVGDGAGKITTVNTGWMVRPDGSLTLNTPFSGFAK